MIFDPNHFTRCVHCGASVPKGNFCVQCERPLLQFCPAERGELVLPLVSASGRPTAQCPDCGISLKTCPVCRRLYAVSDTRCATDGAILCPTTALDDGEAGGSARNPARVWYTPNLAAPAMQPLPNLPATAERAAYAAGRLVVATQSLAAGRRLFSYNIGSGQTSGSEQQHISGTALPDARDTLTLSGGRIGVLNAQSATLYDNMPLQLRCEMPLPSAPQWQVFTPNHWCVITTVAGGLAQIHCYDARTNCINAIPTQVAIQSIFQVLSASGCVVLACHNGEIHEFQPNGSNRSAALTSDANVIGAAAGETGVMLLSFAAGYIYFDRWSAAGAIERVGFIAAPDEALRGLIATPQALYFYGTRSLYAYRLAERELIEETLPAAAEIILANVVTLGDAEHLFVRQHIQNTAKWEIWTPAVSGSRRSIGVPFSTRTLSGLTDAGYYLIAPSANSTGGSNQCEMRLWQFG